MFDFRMTSCPNKKCWDCMYLEGRKCDLYFSPLFYECRLGGHCGNPLLRRCDMYRPGPKQVYFPLADCRKCAKSTEPRRVLGGMYCECRVGVAEGNVYRRYARCRAYEPRSKKRTNNKE